MCGILGLIDRGARKGGMPTRQILDSMLRTLSYRGPDDYGTWQDDGSGVFLGHRRLAIIDLSADGRQPMISASGEHVISFNGEIYNYPALRAALGNRGVSFRSRSDTEVLLEAADRFGLNMTLQQIAGMFAFILYDRKRRQIHFVRDRLGKKPLYIGWAGADLIFGSELKIFHDHPAFEAEIDRNALALYMRYACLPAPFSIFQGVWQIPPGCRLTLSLDDIHNGQDLSPLMTPYWHLPRVVEEAWNRKDDSLTDEQAVSRFSRLLEDSVRDRMISDVPLGAFLSGGIDSSAVTALMQQNAARPVKTFCIGFNEAGFDEAAHAARIASHLGTEHHELYVTPEHCRDIIPRLPDMFDEPFADASAIPTYIVSAFARQTVTVALSGDGGDELLGGYNRHFTAPALWNRINRIPHWARKLGSKAILSRNVEQWDRLRPDHPQFGDRMMKIGRILPLNSPEAIYQSLVSVWPGPEFLVTGATEPLIPLRDPSWQPHAALSFAERMMYGDALSYLPNDVLTKVDRASMAASLEARAPLLDQRLFEYAWSLPERFKIRDGKGKWLLRQVLARHVPPDLFERPKQGFHLPVREWLRGPLRDWASDLLDPHAMRDQGYLNADHVELAWDAHLKGKGDHTQRLWTVLMFQAWLKRWKP